MQNTTITWNEADPWITQIRSSIFTPHPRLEFTFPTMLPKALMALAMFVAGNSSAEKSAC